MCEVQTVTSRHKPLVWRKEWRYASLCGLEQGAGCTSRLMRPRVGISSMLKFTAWTAPDQRYSLFIVSTLVVRRKSHATANADLSSHA